MNLSQGGDTLIDALGKIQPVSWVVMQFGKAARASRPWNHAQDARATFKLPLATKGRRV